MCLAAIAIHAHPQWPLLVLANRDEFHQRPSAPLHVWPNTHPPLLAGKDLQSAGSWLCVDACGNFALLTNVRNSGLIRGESAPSRGQLVLDALRGKIPTPQQASIYSGFNLLAGQLLDAHGQAQVRLRYYTNQTASLPFGWSLTHGLHALSNGALNEPWPKAQRLKHDLDHILKQVCGAKSGEGGSSPGKTVDAMTLEAMAFEALGSTTQAKDEELPDTGVPYEWEKMLSAAKIVSPLYGTRTSALVALRSDGRLYFTEWTYAPSGDVAGTVRLQHQLSHTA